MRTFLCFWVLLGVVWAQVPGGQPSGHPSAEEIFSRSRSLNASLQDMRAEIRLRIQANLGFLTYQPDLLGDYLYKKPDKHKLDIPKAPNYLKKYPNVFGFHLPSLQQYRCQQIEEIAVEGSPCYHLYLINKATKNSDIEHLEIFVDKKNFTVPRYDTYYRQGHLFVTSHYLVKDSFWVFDRMTAEYQTNSVNVSAQADYSNHRFNQNLPDKLFQLQRS